MVAKDANPEHKGKGRVCRGPGRARRSFPDTLSSFIAAAVKVSEEIFEEMIAKTRVDALLSHSEPGSSPRLRHVAFVLEAWGFQSTLVNIMLHASQR